MEHSTKEEGTIMRIRMSGTGFAAAMMALALFTAAANAAGDPAAGAKIAAKKCAQCHGATGAGDGATLQQLGSSVTPANWNDKAAMSKYTDDQLTKIITSGGKSIGKSPLMPAFKAKLKGDQITDVVAYVKSLAK